MGMPRKGSRKIQLEGEMYLWRVRGDGYSRRWRGASPVVLTLTCQRDEDKTGRVMQATLFSLNPPADTPDYGPVHTATLHAHEVKQIIAHARSKGWDPAERGKAFELEPRAHQPQPSQYKIVEPGSWYTSGSIF